MKRKIIQLAGKTLVVSLPIKWARNYGIAKGHEIDIEERGQQIVLSTEQLSSVEKVEIDASKLDADVVRRWLLAALHKSGYDEIEITYDSPAMLKVIRETVDGMLIGFAIVDQSKSKCVIRTVAKGQEKEFDSMLRRTFLVTKSLGESMEEYLERNKLSELPDLLNLEKTNNQLTNFCERILNSKGYHDYRKTNFVYVIVWNLEKICDDYKNICLFLAKPENSKVKITSIIGLLKKCNKLFDSYYELFYKFDINKLADLNNDKKIIDDKFFEFLKESNQQEAYVLSLLHQFSIKVSDLSASYIALNT